MTTSDFRPQTNAGRRFIWALLVSILVNGALWVTYPQLSLHPEFFEHKTVASTIRIEHRRVRSPDVRRRAQPRRKKIVRPFARPRPIAHKRVVPKKIVVKPKAIVKPKPIVVAVKPRLHHVRPHAHPRRKTLPTDEPLGTVTGSFSRRQSAVLALPKSWATQDYANLAAANTTIWLDFKKARGASVPRVFLLNLKMSYMSGPTLHDAIHDIVGNLREDGARVFVSKAQPVCGGKRMGWFLSYEKPDEDPPWAFESTMFVVGDTIYRAIYERPDGQAEDPRTRAALNTLCPLP